MAASIQPAVLTLRIDTAAAKRELDDLDRERKETGRAAQVDPSARRDSESAGGRGSEDQRSREDRERRSQFDPASGPRGAFQFARGALTGNLAGQVDQMAQGAAAAIPGGGAAYRGARLAAQYGPIVSAAVEELLPSGMAPIGEAMTSAASIASKGVARAEAALNAYDQVMQDLRPVARLQERHGAVDRDSLGQFAKNLYTVYRVRENWMTDRGLLGQDALGRAMAGLLTQRGALE